MGNTTSCEWTVTGMDCGSCAGKVRGAVAHLPGVSAVEVTLMTERLRLTLDETQTSRAHVEAAVQKLGFGIAPKGQAAPRTGFVLPEGTFAPKTPDLSPAEPDTPQDMSPPASGTASADPAWHHTGKGRLVIGTGLLLVLAWAVKLFAAPDFAQAAFGLATLIGIAPVARRAVNAARARMPFTIEMLMTIAATGALFIGAAEEAALVVFLFAVGEVLEGVAANKARDGIRALAQLVPKTALLEIAGRWQEVPVGRLLIGQTVLVRPGDRVPADGEVIEGVSGVDESPVTGESVPKVKEPGQPVFAGSINTEAALRIRVTKAAEDNTIARIVRLVEEAESARAPTERFIDRFSRIYMPAVVGTALLVAIVPPLAFAAPWDVWVYRALALLLIGCPCALVISVPASIASALSAGARHGILMKGGAVIEAVARTTHIAFDKTGTLTLGLPQITDIVPVGGTPAEVLALAAGIEAGSSHPLAQAILSRAAAEGVAPVAVTAARAVPGKGAEARVGDAVAWVGSPRFAAASGVMDAAARHKATELEEAGKTVVVVFWADRLVGLVALRDAPRPDAAEAMRQLKSLGIDAVMLTGDNQRTAAAVAQELGMDHRAELMPEDKVAAIREMTARGRVMMVGDGINDAPALASAHVGVAMGSGTDVALETADAAMLRNRVTDVAGTIRLARSTMANIRQNVAIALGLKGVFLVTTVLGMTGLWLAILADTGATVLVTLNALRLLAFDPDKEG
ncbi:heavy metal translocating P-type ATPase [Phaeovulum sp. W22_SRMD_FR3]|uniref:heavy metal translocating P-type ATPase n=1 Tax=Phaeovulum sp. W22_SRMD_FR3 TaxID=3240274 RepID=UPI003F988DDE